MRVELICHQCGKTYKVAPYRASISHFCGTKCYWVYLKSIKGEKSPSWKGGEIKLTCRECGKIFYVKKYRIESKQAKWCSVKCHNQYQKRTQIKVECEYCGKIFSVNPAQTAPRDDNRLPRRFCSQKCNAVATRWNGGPELSKERSVDKRREGRKTLEGPYGDSYLKGAICSAVGKDMQLSYKDILPEFIDFKRAHLKLIRGLADENKNNNTRG